MSRYVKVKAGRSVIKMWEWGNGLEEGGLVTNFTECFNGQFMYKSIVILFIYQILVETLIKVILYSSLVSDDIQ